MARFLAVVLGALIGLGVVWFAVVKPRQGSPEAAASTDAPGMAVAATGASEKAPADEGAPPAPPLKESDFAETLAALTSDDDVVRGSAIEEWGTKYKSADGKSTIERLALEPMLMAALRERLSGMPEDRLILYVEAWGENDWWVKNFPEAHGRYAAWRAGADDTVWVPYAYDQLDRFDPVTDLESIRLIHEALLKSKSDKVRARVLESAAFYFGASARTYALEHLTDPSNPVARCAWIIAAKTGDTDTTKFDWATGPRFVGEAVLYTMAVYNPVQLEATCEFLETDPVVGKWYEKVIPYLRQRAQGATDSQVIITLNQGQGPARIFEEAIRIEGLLKGENAEYVQE